MRKLLPFLILLCAVSVHAQTLQHKYQKNCNSSGTTTCALTITAPGSGDLLIVSGITRTQHLGGASNDCTTSISTSSGTNAFSNISNVQFDSVNNYYIYTCYAANVTNGPTTVTVTLNANSTNVYEMAVFDVSGAATASVLDQSSNNVGPGCPGACTTNASPVSSSVTTTAANEYLFCGAVDSSSTATWSAPTNSFTIEQSQSGGHNAQLDRVVTSKLTTSCGVTLSTAQFWSVTIATFKAASQPIPGSVVSGPSEIAGPAFVD